MDCLVSVGANLSERPTGPVGNMLLRCDSTPATGTGHIMRCLALAQAWQDYGGDAIFAISDPSSFIADRIRNEGMNIANVSAVPGTTEDASELSQLAALHDAQWIVIDGYIFNLDYQFAVKRSGAKLLLVDDLANSERYVADIVLNQNAFASEELYSKRESYCRLLLGPSYVMLRREFAASGPIRAVAPLATKILVTMGGSDPDNLSLRVLEALVSMKEFEATIVIGPGHQSPHEIRKAVSSDARRVRVVFNPDKMREIMLWADLAVIAAGGTLWELLSLGTPVLSYSRNAVQAEILQKLQQETLIHFLGNSDSFDAKHLMRTVRDLAMSPVGRGHLSELGMRYVDGLGATRVCQALQGKS